MGSVLQRELEGLLGDQAEPSRYTCPFCDARRGMAVDFDRGDTGVLHCFGCDWSGTGAQLRAELVYGDRNPDSIAQALEDFGIRGESDSIDSAVRRHEETKEAIEEEEKEDDPLLRIEKAKARMTDEELGLFLTICSQLNGVYSAHVVGNDDGTYSLRDAGDVLQFDICDCGRSDFQDSAPFRPFYEYDDRSPHNFRAFRKLSMRVHLYPEDRKILEEKMDELVDRAMERDPPPRQDSKDLESEFLNF